MNEFITNVLSDSTIYLVISFSMSICFFAWFLGYAIRLILGLLYKINNVI